METEDVEATVIVIEVVIDTRDEAEIARLTAEYVKSISFFDQVSIAFSTATFNAIRTNGEYEFEVEAS